MKIVLLSGCSGWRLWPLSNESRSKQFLKLLSNGENARESMVQRVVRQIKESGAIKDNDIYIVTAESQADSIRNQLGSDVSVICEPTRRDTFPALAMACEYLHHNGLASSEETVVVMPIDTYADDSFYGLINELDGEVQKNDADIVLVGTKPTYPSAKYGYISTSGDDMSVKAFKEKPSEDEAEILIVKGAYWNTGVAAFKLGFMLNSVQKYAGKIDSLESFVDSFEKLPKKSFDYEILENNKNMKTLIYGGKWKDLGTWNTLTEEMKEKSIGHVRQGEECVNTHVINELSIPILVLGAKDMVVAASPDGILVSDKHKSSYIKPYVQQMDARPMYEERKWGEYKVLDYNQYGDGMKSLTKHLTISAGKSISYQKHFRRDEIWTIVDGEGDLLIDDEIRHMQRGDVAYIRKGQKHALKADDDKDLQFIEVQIGPELVEDDIERFDWKWK
ncbi:MAG: cupin domain-containing protein [Lachnospiraceae bacterium]|jgi:mannose-1-phosphate guanylyltransferase|nr:cupin domain-containing protein [Lachnospiraceae bacterium]